MTALEHNLTRAMQMSAAEMDRALILGAFLNALATPTPVQQWLERAAEQLRAERDPDDSRKSRRDKLVIRVMERDGADCWFCGKPLLGDVTLEHLMPLALGGTWEETNLALAHRGCNKTAGHLTRAEKEKLRAGMPAELEGTKA